MSKYVTICGALSHIHNTRNALLSYCSHQTNRYVFRSSHSWSGTKAEQIMFATAKRISDYKKFTPVLMTAHFSLRVREWYTSIYTHGYATSSLCYEDILLHGLSGVSCRLLKHQNCGRWHVWVLLVLRCYQQVY